MNGIRNKEKLIDAVKKLWKLDIDKDIKKKLMDELIWKIGETPNGKYKLKYRSEGAIGITNKKLLHHEHVVSREYLKEKLVEAETEKDLMRVIRKIKTCIVTRKEHERLGKEEDWKKYKKAEIKVFDVSGDKPKRVV